MRRGFITLPSFPPRHEPHIFLCHDLPALDPWTPMVPQHLCVTPRPSMTQPILEYLGDSTPSERLRSAQGWSVLPLGMEAPLTHQLWRRAQWVGDWCFLMVLRLRTERGKRLGPHLTQTLSVVSQRPSYCPPGAFLTPSEGERLPGMKKTLRDTFLLYDPPLKLHSHGERALSDRAQKG